MKSVFVGTIDSEKKFYYIIDAKSKDSDGVISNGETSKVVNFWKTASKSNTLKPIKSTNFHKFLWDNEHPEGTDEDRWNRVFVNKTQKISDHMLSGVQIVSDVLKSKMKAKSINYRISEFKSLLETQNTSIVRAKTMKTLPIQMETK
jgi:hypothetical protein